MIRYLSMLLLLSFVSCKKSDEVTEQKASCFIEKTTDENGAEMSVITYDSKHRAVSFSAYNKKLNYTITYDDAKNTKLVKSNLFGEMGISYSADRKISKVSSGYGTFEFKYNDKSISEINFESAHTPIINNRSKLTNYKFEYIGENVSKVFMNNGTAINNFLVFEGIEYDNKHSIYPQELKEYFLITGILNYHIISQGIDFSVISKNNPLSIKSFQFTIASFMDYQYSYTYNSDEYPTQIQYKGNNNSFIKYNYSYGCF